MKVQAIDTEGRICFNTDPYDLIYERILEYSKHTPYFPLFERLDQDFAIAHADLAPMVETIRRDIERARRELPPESELRIPPDHFLETVVLGEPLRLYPMLPPHGRLLRLHGLFSDLKQAAEDQADLAVFLIPRLTSLQYRILRLVKESAGGIESELLPEALRREYRRLLVEETFSEELRASFRNQLSTLDAAAVASDVAELKKWKLVQEGSDGKAIVPTEKLRLIRL